MARIRSIKPEFSHDEVVGKMSLEVRLLFVLLWPLADDEGRFRAHAALVKAECFPYDADLPVERVDGWLRALHDAGRIRLYDHAGQQYGVVVNFLKHQKISKPSMSRLPKPPHDLSTASTTPTQGIPGTPRVSTPGLEGIGREGKGKGLEGRGAGRETQKPQTAGASGPPPAAGAETEAERKRLDDEARRTLEGVLSARKPRSRALSCETIQGPRLTRAPPWTRLRSPEPNAESQS